MKTLLLLGSLLLLGYIRVTAQQIQLPAVELSIIKDKVPYEVKSAFMNDFGESHLPFSWVPNKKKFNTSRLEAINFENTEFFQFTLIARLKNGSTLDAAYSPEGKLLAYRENIINLRPASNIMANLQNTEYKDWSLKKTFHVKKANYKGLQKERIGLVMVKGKEKRTILLDPNGQVLADLKGELADATWEDAGNQ